MLAPAALTQRPVETRGSKFSFEAGHDPGFETGGSGDLLVPEFAEPAPGSSHEAT